MGMVLNAQECANATDHARESSPQAWRAASTVTLSEVRGLEEELDSGAAVAAARRFYSAVAALPRAELLAGGAMRPVWSELARQLESFNPVFTAVLLKCQLTMGVTGYHERDEALQRLIQPLAGEYGLSAGRPLGKTHRRLFAEFYESVAEEPLAKLLETERPHAAEDLFSAMMRDVLAGGGREGVLEQAAYAVGYNLAVEFVASRLSGFALESWRTLDRRHGLAGLSWDFLETHSDGEPGHAEVGRQTATAFVPAEMAEVMRAGMRDHDRDFAAFNHRLADMLEHAVL